MIGELEKFVFTNPHKGRCLKAYLLLAMGDVELGIRDLKDYIETTKERISNMRVKNPKVVSQCSIAEEILTTC